MDTSFLYFIVRTGQALVFVLSLGTVILYTIIFDLSIGFENIFHFFGVLYLKIGKTPENQGFFSDQNIFISRFLSKTHLVISSKAFSSDEIILYDRFARLKVFLLAVPCRMRNKSTRSKHFSAANISFITTCIYL